MTNDIQLGGLYVLIAVMLVVGMLISRRGPAARLATTLLASVAILVPGSSCSPFGTISASSCNG